MVDTSPSINGGRGMELGKNYVADEGYLNFLREYRLRNTELTRLEAIKGAPKCWSALSHYEKERYRSMPNITTYLSSVDNVGSDAEPGCEKRKPACPKKPKCPKKQTCPKKQSCAKKPTCPKKQTCAKKPTCPKKRKKNACAKKKTCPRKNTCSKKPSCSVKRKPKCCPKRNACPKKRQSCSKPGPVTNNGYLNFIRSYRKKHCNLKPKELVMRAARAWCRLPECKKDRYRRMACKVTKSARHKRRRVCTGKQ